MLKGKKGKYVLQIMKEGERKIRKEEARRTTALTVALTTAESQPWKRGRDDRAMSRDKELNYI